MKTILFITLSLLIVGCSNGSKKEKNNEKTDSLLIEIKKPVDIGRKDIPIYDEIAGIKNKLSEIAENIEFCALANEPLLDGSLVSDVTLTDNDIFLSRGVEAVYRFNRSGTFENKVGSLGQGPAEYAQLGGLLQIDENEKTITVIDAAQLKAKTYSYDGHFLRSFRIGRDATTLAMMDTSLYIVRTKDSERYRPGSTILRLMDNKGKVVKTFKSHIYPVEKGNTKDWHYGPMENALWKYGNHFYSLEYGSDTIFRIDGKELIADRTLSGNKFRPSLYELFHSSNSGKRLLIPLMMRPNSDVFESDRFVIFRCFEESKKLYFLVYDKTDGKIYQSLHENAPRVKQTDRVLSAYFTDDLVSGMPFNPEYRSGDKLIGWLSASDIVENRSKILEFMDTHASTQMDGFRKKVENMKEEDNPVLMIVKLK